MTPALDPGPHTVPFSRPRRESTASSALLEAARVCVGVCGRRECERLSRPRRQAFNLVCSPPPPQPIPGLDPVSEARGSRVLLVPGTLCPAEWRPSSAGVPTPPCSPGLGVHALVRFRTFLNLGERWSEDVRELEQPSPAAMCQVQPRVYFRGRDAHTSGLWVGAASRLDTRTVVLGGGCWRSAAWTPECFASTGAQGVRRMREAGTGVGLGQEGRPRN